MSSPWNRNKTYHHHHHHLLFLSPFFPSSMPPQETALNLVDNIFLRPHLRGLYRSSHTTLPLLISITLFSLSTPSHNPPRPHAHPSNPIPCLSAHPTLPYPSRTSVFAGYEILPPLDLPACIARASCYCLVVSDRYRVRPTSDEFTDGLDRVVASTVSKTNGSIDFGIPGYERGWEVGRTDFPFPSLGVGAWILFVCSGLSTNHIGVCRVALRETSGERSIMTVCERESRAGKGVMATDGNFMRGFPCFGECGCDARFPASRILSVGFFQGQPSCKIPPWIGEILVAEEGLQG